MPWGLSSWGLAPWGLGEDAVIFVPPSVPADLLASITAAYLAWPEHEGVGVELWTVKAPDDQRPPYAVLTQQATTSLLETPEVKVCQETLLLTAFADDADEASARLTALREFMLGRRFYEFSGGKARYLESHGEPQVSHSAAFWRDGEPVYSARQRYRTNVHRDQP